MAATRLIALHKNKGMTVAACLKNRTDYIENPDKTEQGQFVSSYACSTLTADEEFMLTKRQYDLVNGRRQKSDVIAYGSEGQGAETLYSVPNAGQRVQ